MLHLKILEKQLLHFYFENSDNLMEPNYFLSGSAIKIYDVLLSLKEKNISFNKDNITKELSIQKVLSDSEIESVCKSIYETDYVLEETNLYEKNLMSLYMADDILSNDLQKLILELNEDNCIDLQNVSSVVSKIDSKIEEVNSHGEPESYSVQNIWEKAYTILQDKEKGNILKYPSGCPYLDKVLPGHSLYPGEISLITGHPGSGKTTFFDYLASQRIFRNYPTIQIDSERTFESTVLRKTCSLLQVSRDDLLNSDFDTTYFNKVLEEEIQKSSRNKYFKYYYPFELKEGQLRNTVNFNIEYIENKIMTARKEMGLSKKDSLVAFIDLITMMEEMSRGVKGQSKADSIEYTYNLLSSLSKITNTHIMGSMQQRRNDGTKKIRDEDDLEIFRPTTESIKSSSGAEERCRIIFGLYRKKHFMKKYLSDSPQLEVTDDILEVQVLKNNDGEVGSIIPYLCQMNYNKLYAISDNSLINKSTIIAGK
jgi:KaiC/GvpD/RAD55 family RecA-like ATPase